MNEVKEDVKNCAIELARGACALDAYEEAPHPDLRKSFRERRSDFEALIPIARRLHEKYPGEVSEVDESIARIVVGGMCLYAGDYDAAWEHCLKGQEISYKCGNLEGIVRSTHYLARAALCQGKLELAASVLRSTEPQCKSCEDDSLRRKIEADAADVATLLDGSWQ
jgi:hypothetical protein